MPEALVQKMGDGPPTRRVGLFGMVVMGFFWVCGGMYGNEELLGTAPPALVLLALIVVPCCHSLPVSMMIAECGTAWPADGGLPVFVQHAFGDTIGGHNTFFTWLNCLVDAAIYPVMAASYTRELLGHYQLAVDERLVCVAIVVLMTAMQLRGLDWMVRTLVSTQLPAANLNPNPNLNPKPEPEPEPHPQPNPGPIPHPSLSPSPSPNPRRHYSPRLTRRWWPCTACPSLSSLPTLRCTRRRRGSCTSSRRGTST